MNYRLSSYAGIAAVVFFSVALVLAVTNFRDYDPFRNYMSDLGVNDSSSLYFNTGAVITGIIGILFAAGLHEKMRYTFTLASIGLIGVGFFHSKLETEHLVFAGTFFILSAITMLLASEHRKGPEKYFLIEAGLMPFVFILTFLPILEHLAVAGIMISILLLSVKRK